MLYLFLKSLHVVSVVIVNTVVNRATREVIGASLKIELAGPSSAFGTCQNSLQSSHRK